MPLLEPIHHLQEKPHVLEPLPPISPCVYQARFCDHFCWVFICSLMGNSVPEAKDPGPPHCHFLCPNPILQRAGGGSVSSGPAEPGVVRLFLSPHWCPRWTGCSHHAHPPGLAPHQVTGDAGSSEALQAWATSSVALLSPHAPSHGIPGKDAGLERGLDPLSLGCVPEILGPPAPSPSPPTPRRRPSGVGLLPWELCIGIYFETIS